MRVTKSPKAHIMDHDALKKLSNFSFAWHRCRGFLGEGVEKEEFPTSSKIFLKTIKNPFPRTWDSIHHKTRDR